MTDPIRDAAETVVRISAPGFSLVLRFDPSDEADCEILAEAYLLVKRRADAQNRKALGLGGEE